MLGNRGSAHHNGGRRQEPVVLVPCVGGCGKRVPEKPNDFNLCPTCYPLIVGASNGVDNSCSRAHNPSNKDVAR